MDLSEANLSAPDSCDVLLAAMDQHVSKLKSDEGRDLFKAGSGTKCPIVPSTC